MKLLPEQREFVVRMGAYAAEPVWRVKYGGFPFQSHSGVSRWKSEADARRAFKCHLHTHGGIFDYVRLGMIGTTSPACSFHPKELPALIKTLEEEHLLFFIDDSDISMPLTHFGPD